MIQARDLRVGNLICYDPLYPIPKEIEGIVNDKEIATDYRKLLTVDDIYPIPLTEEWLTKCGFVIGIGQATGFYAGVNGIAIQKAGNDWWICLRGIESYQLIRAVNFVHELQNCAFILTGQELEIKP